MSNESYLMIAMEAKAHQGEFLPSMIYHDLPIKHADLSLQDCQITQGIFRWPIITMEHPLFIDRFPIKISISNGFPGFPSQPRLMTPEGLLYTERVETTKPADRGPFRSLPEEV